MKSGRDINASTALAVDDLFGFQEVKGLLHGDARDRELLAEGADSGQLGAWAVFKSQGAQVVVERFHTGIGTQLSFGRHYVERPLSDAGR